LHKKEAGDGELNRNTMQGLPRFLIHVQSVFVHKYMIMWGNVSIFNLKSTQTKVLKLLD
jgi:hypothetical protein